MDFADSPWLWDSGTPRPTFERDFARDKELDRGGTGPAITFERASSATYFDASGVLQTAAINEPRFDHDPATGSCRGLLIEESRTNSFPNSQAGGAEAPSTLPTNWATAAGALTVNVIGVGTEDGLSYVDIQLVGTTNSSSSGIRFASTTSIVGASPQTWSFSASARIVAGSTSGLTQIVLNVFGRTASNVATSDSSSSANLASTLGASSLRLNRLSYTAALADAATERVNGQILFGHSSGATIDITLRIAAPQLEQGAFATSYIPTTTAEVTRSADVATVSPISSFYSATESTMLAEFQVRGPLPSARYVQFDDETNNNRIVLGLTSGASVQNFTTVGGSTSLSASVSVSPNEIVAGTIYKIGAAFAADDAISARNGTLGGPDPTGSVPSGIVRLLLSGQPPSINTRQGLWLRRFAYWPKRLSNKLLEQLTT
jgi:hypothetical protein